jgi:squalene synthase HpnC
MATHSSPPSEVQALPVTHPENFPVASWLCPPALRPAIAAIYAFARAADDIADEGDLPAAERLAQLQAFRNALHNPASAVPASANSATGVTPAFLPEIFIPLQQIIAHHALPVHLLDDLLKAFEQDVQASEQGSTYDDLPALLRYCQLSANPVGRMLLHLYGVHDDASLVQSDAICSALQLINFWQDLSEDLPRGRFYLPQDLARQLPSDALIESLCRHAQGLMLQGAPLVHTVPGRAGWELRLVVQGGLRILEKVRALGPRVMHTRPQLTPWDLALMFWRSLWMRPRRWENRAP